jgi:Zn-finger nucleic acid-binding protein
VKRLRRGRGVEGPAIGAQHALELGTLGRREDVRETTVQRASMVQPRKRGPDRPPEAGVDAKLAVQLLERGTQPSHERRSFVASGDGSTCTIRLAIVHGDNVRSVRYERVKIREDFGAPSAGSRDDAIIKDASWFRKATASGSSRDGRRPSGIGSTGMTEAKSTAKPPGKSSHVCAICSGRLQPQTLEGIRFNVCADHGVWLDRGELSKLIKTLKVRRRQKAAMRREIADVRATNESLAFFSGIWGLME